MLKAYGKVCVHKLLKGYNEKLLSLASMSCLRRYSEAYRTLLDTDLPYFNLIFVGDKQWSGGDWKMGLMPGRACFNLRWQRGWQLLSNAILYFIENE